MPGKARLAGTVIVGLVVVFALFALLRSQPPPFTGLDLALGPGSFERLDRLQLPPGVTDLSWLPSDLESLSVYELTDETIAQLPRRLRNLEVRIGGGADPLADLSSLPPTLETLRMEGLPLRRLGELPTGLRRLRLGRVDRFDADDVPESVSELALESVRTAELWRGLSGVESLHLTGPRVRGIAGIERFERLEGLTLSRTLTDRATGLPPRLRYLELDGNRFAAGWTLADLPPSLVELRLRNQRLEPRDPDATESSRLPQSLRVLHVLSAEEVEPELIAALPDGLVELRLDGIGSLPLCDSAGPRRVALPAVETLRLGAGVEVDLGCLPASLTALHVEAVPPEDLARIEVPLSRLGVLYSFDLDLATIAFPASGLKVLDLSFSRPAALDLASLSSLERLRFLASPWDRLPELPASLRELDLGGSPRLASLEGLDRSCQRLRVLRVGETPLASLEGVPASVRELDVRGMEELAGLDGLPDLDTLTISAAALRNLGRLPPSLKDLTIVGP